MTWHFFLFLLRTFGDDDGDDRGFTRRGCSRHTFLRYLGHIIINTITLSHVHHPHLKPIQIRFRSPARQGTGRQLEWTQRGSTGGAFSEAARLQSPKSASFRQLVFTPTRVLHLQGWRTPDGGSGQHIALQLRTSAGGRGDLAFLLDSLHDRASVQLSRLSCWAAKRSSRRRMMTSLIFIAVPRCTTHQFPKGLDNI
ncbi:hypothetical protein B0J14DRAFT_370712 [Halenospora varia]|nr:hypothetical protein B0J14DRAFT_370712 [Halenospora varia]